MEKVRSWIRGSLIGVGAFGKVNLALNRENGEMLAVKSIECNERTRGEMQAMENELQILESLDSPFVVKCLGSDFSMEDGRSMRNVFMEYMPGGSVADLMKKFGGHFDEALIRNYTRSILEGLRYLHSQNIVHCDIKGKNVLVGSSGVKLADFGGAKRVPKDGGDAAAAAMALMLDPSIVNVKGTPLWMAPEVVNQVEQGPPSDIWSLGCTVVEMATGKAPWSEIAISGNPFVTLFHIGCKEIIPDLPSCLSKQGQDFLSKCFQRDPTVRWTAAQLLQHPFIVDNFWSIQSSSESFGDPVPPQQVSPTSVLNCHSLDTSTLMSSVVSSVPLLKFPVFPKHFAQITSNFFQTEEAPLRENCLINCTTPFSSPSTCGSDFWCDLSLSPQPSDWIIVRSLIPVSPAPPAGPGPASIPMSPTSVPSRELVPIAFRLGAQEKSTVFQVSEDLSPPVEKDDKLRVFSSAPTEVEKFRGCEEQLESSEISAEGKPSCSGGKQTPCHLLVEDDDMLLVGQGALEIVDERRRSSGIGAGTSSSCRGGPGSAIDVRSFWRRKADTLKLKSWRNKWGNLLNSREEPCQSFPINCRPWRSKLKYASLRTTVRTLESAYRRVSRRERRKLSLQSALVHKARWKVCKAWQKLADFRQIISFSLFEYHSLLQALPFEKLAPRSSVESVVCAKSAQLPLFGNKLFLSKRRPSPTGFHTRYSIVCVFVFFLGSHYFNFFTPSLASGDELYRFEKFPSFVSSSRIM